MDQPLVTVICLCHNQRPYLEESIRSVWNQTYASIELIIVDDGSSDGSKELIKSLLLNKQEIEWLDIPESIGNCKAFNLGFVRARGSYIIDLAADDVMDPERITRQVEFFEKQPKDVGLIHSDAVYINEKGDFVREHVAHLRKKGLVKNIPQGDVYQQVLRRYFIAPPTMMFRKAMLDQLQGYDEALAYEDFDIWVRGSRNWKFMFQNELLTKIRLHAKSKSAGWYESSNKLIYSTYLILEKAISLNRNAEDREAWQHRVGYELRQSVLSGNYQEAELFYSLLKKEHALRLKDRLIYLLKYLPFSLRRIQHHYHRIFYQR